MRFREPLGREYQSVWRAWDWFVNLSFMFLFCLVYSLIVWGIIDFVLWIFLRDFTISMFFIPVAITIPFLMLVAWVAGGEINNGRILEFYCGRLGWWK